MYLDPRYEMAKLKLGKVKKAILVASGKGGVGKSLIATSLALILKEKGFKVGLLDLDIHGPSTNLILRVRKKPTGDRKGLKPINANGLEYMSLTLLVGEKPLAFRGETKEKLVLSIFAETSWDLLDFLVVDLPPGTGDEVVVTLRLLREKALAVVVTIPSILSLNVVRRLLRLLTDEKILIRCLVENMSYLRYGNSVIELFGRSEAYTLAEEFGIKDVLKLPLNPELEELLRRGESPLLSQEWKRCMSRLADLVTS
ncbi:MAG: ATP-binding protein [Thermoprotei archaeon]|nr:MAG: ATP-binding protein [Thermoprotei archaeon]RLF02268.1 MAG: ATP-binding protein [Thermoprotei archaeon]